MSDQPKSVTVFCASRIGDNPEYLQAAKDLGKGLAKHRLNLVYGGGNIGLMGSISNAVLDEGGEVKGVIPSFLQEREAIHTQVHDMVVTNDMHTRKKQLYAKGDAFVILPGGLGTFDETFEILTWRQLGLHNKPIFIVNIAQWADAFHNLLETIVKQKFAEPSILNLYKITPDIPSTLNLLINSLNPVKQPVSTEEIEITAPIF